MTKKKKERADKYWTCDECRPKLGLKLPKGGLMGVTCIAALCGHCDREDEATLVPTIDYIQADGSEPIWD